MLSKNSFSLFRYIITGTIELTSLFAYIDLIRSAIIVKRLTRRQLEGRRGELVAYNVVALADDQKQFGRLRVRAEHLQF